ncbi:MdtA [Desulforapulum autotrophicum HRM2]|uniref:MdtA n=1 Tax=Desulforapulum autotrophicum (strain ATCC 43914 / DSM 3382 / VKM B-1955 / HRM2) TaxID=177437 RepID=C0QMG4_DESAH|nr:efflux RND transporter periplasmic adaptor subunit [Desulforapulum autotrophicum]ACN16481.1 MdtA [Desulforapulum autotrophicum HRM2]
MKPRRLIVLTVTVLIVSSFFIGAHCLALNAETVPDASDAADTRGVVIEKVGITNINAEKKYPGTVKASKTAKLAFRVAGPLIRVNIKPGDAVKRGQVLMQIDPQDYEDRIRVLEAQKAGVVAQLDTANLDFARIETLFNKKVIPEVDHDHAKNSVRTLTSSVTAIDAQLLIARHQLAYTSLRAPYDAIITAQLIENNEMVQPGRVVLGLHAIDTLEIEIKVPENEIISRGLRRGSEALASFPARPDKRFQVVLSEWNTDADPVTRTYAMVFTLPAPKDFMVLPGMTAEVIWSTPQNEDSSITIPAKALVTDSSGDSSVWVFDAASSTARKTKVEVGSLNGASRIIIKQGLAIGDQIVVKGVDFIRSDMTLKDISMEGNHE